jgi:hypothetical protein
MKLDLPSGDAGVYEACSFGQSCAEGLECVTIAYGKDIMYTECTIACTDASECPAAPRGWTAACVMTVDPTPRCVIGCNKGEPACPNGFCMAPVDGTPYCVPQ